MPDAPPPPDHAAAQLITYLQGVTQALVALRTQDEVFDLILRDALEALGAIGGAVLLVRGKAFSVAARRGHDDASVWQDGDLEAPLPGSDALRLNTPLFFTHHGDLTAAYPELEAQTSGIAPVATAVLPMVEEDRPLGVIILDFKEPHAFTPDEVYFLLTLAAQCAVALGRAEAAKLLEARVEERTQQLEEERAALKAFVAFTEAVGSETDVQILVRQAITLLHETCEVEVAYFERAGELFQVTLLSPSADPTLLPFLQHGFPLQHSGIAQRLRQNTAAFIDHWKDTELLIDASGIYQAVAGYPYFVAGELASVLMMGARTSAIWAERDKGIFRAVGRSLDLALERAKVARHLEEQNAELHVQTLALEGVAELTRDLTLPGGREQLIEQVMDLVLSVLPSGYASFWEISDGLWRLTTQRGDVGRPDWQAARERGFPVGRFPTLDQPWQTQQPYFQGYYDPVHDAVPELMDHLLSIASLPVMVRGEPVGVLGVGLFGHREWSAADRALLETAVHSLGLGLERAKQIQQLEAESRAREAFAAFTEAVGTQTDVTVLAQQAIEVLQDRFPQASVGYYEREGELWKARVWSDDVSEAVVALIRAGVPAHNPFIAEPLQTRQPVFKDAWSLQHEQLERTDEYGTVGNYPLIVSGQVEGILSIGLRGVKQWGEADKALVRSVGRGLTLALERTVTSRQIEQQNADLSARTRALEGFAELTRDLGLSTDRSVLIERALQLVMSLLSAGYAVFWQLQDGQWRVTARFGEVGNPALQAAMNLGFPVGKAPTLDLPHQRREPLFQDQYDRTLDVDPALVDHVSTVATLPVMINGEVSGIFTVVLFGQQPWSPAERAVLLTAARSLGLALERAEQARALTAQRDSLQAANEELEAFTYSVSHDLRTPVRHIVGFSGLLRRSLPEPLSEKAARYFDVVETAAVNLNRLIDGMLELSRTSRQPLQAAEVNLGRLLDAVRKEVTVAEPARQITWQVAPLPTIMGDATLLRRVVSALLTNAVKYTKTREEALIEVWAEDREQTWAVFVRDNGVGFDPRYQDKLFTVFQRLHRQEDFEGAGVNLANARRIVVRHGGLMTAEGQVDQGATFGFVLPKASL